MIITEVPQQTESDGKFNISCQGGAATLQYKPTGAPDFQDVPNGALTDGAGVTIELPRCQIQLAAATAATVTMNRVRNI